MSDDTSGIALTRRRLLGGVATAGAAATAAGAGTYALFSDTETSSNNTVSMGTLDLEANDGGFTVSSNVDVAPGDFVNFYVDFKNVGSIEADHLQLSFDYSVNDPADGLESDTDGSSGSEMGKLFQVTRAVYGNNPNSPGSTEEFIVNDGSGISDANGNGYLDLHDLSAQNWPSADDLTPPPASGTEKTLFVQLVFIDTDNMRYNSGFGTMPNYSGSLTNNQFQGDELDFQITAGLHQESSQDL